MAKKCGVCNVTLRSSDYMLDCDGFCRQSHHLKCVGIEINEKEFIFSHSNNVKWFCDKCIVFYNYSCDMHKQLDDFKRTVISELREFRMLLNLNSAQPSLVGENVTPDVKPETAQILKPTVRIRPVQNFLDDMPEARALSSLLHEESATSNKVVFTQSGPPSRRLSNFDTRSETSTSSHRPDVSPARSGSRDSFSMDTELTISQNDGHEKHRRKKKISEKLPRVKIICIKEDLNEADLTNDILRRNSFLHHNHSVLKVTNIKRMRHGNTAIVECDPLTFRLIMDKEKLHVGSISCKVFEHERVSDDYHLDKCGKCGKLDHNTEHCKVDKEDAEKIPEFVPSHCRFVCCADGCNYLCPEESNLRHHLEALHDGESSFVCAHCKRDLSPTDVDGLIKHFKLHGLSLFKCQYCSYVHNLQHKVTRHLAEDHADLPSKVVTIRSLEAEPKDQERVPVTPTEPPPPAAQNKSSRPWRCCMCKYRCSTVEEIEAHALNKHEIDSQYKCTLCTYKSKDDTTFESHFQENHPGMVKDIIHVYRKEEEQAKAAEGDQQFDTTPLWQRDKPRVRHIRGILFEETAPGKSPKKPVKASPGPASASNSLNLDLSIEAVATGTSFLDETSTAPDDVFESINRQIKESEEDIAKAKDELTKQNVIVIDDDDEDETVEVVEPVPTPVLKVPEPMVKAEVMRDEVDDNQEDEFECKTLKKEFGGLGQPFNKQFQCPKCENFKTKRVMDFIYHIYKDMKCNRFKCKICELGSVTEEFMKKHIANEHPSGNTVTDIVPLRANRKLEEWIQYVLRCQSKIILKNNAAQDPATNADATPAATATENLDCPFCDKKFGNISLLRDHQLTHWSVKPFECKLCKYKAPTEFSAKKHHKLTHSGEAVSYQTVAPLVTDVIKKPKIQHKKPKAKRSCPTVSNEDNSKKPKLDKINEAGPSKTTETVAVEKNGTTDKSSSDTIKYFACEICLEVAKSYKEIEKHIKTKHENSAIRYKKIHHSLNPKSEDLVGCNYCSFTGTEVDLRLHHQDKHTEDIKFKPYKFTCFECSEKLSATNGIKLHYKKHPGKACKYLTLTNQILEIPMQTMTYKCPMCDYSTTSTTTANISLHLKKHFRSYQCGNCKAAFSTRSECSNHLVNEHSDPNIPVAENDGKGPEFQNLMKEIIRTAKLVKPGEISSDKRKTARKSTASYLRMEEFSYYGVKPEPEDLKKITTTVELDSVDVTMTVEQLTKIYNIFPDVSVEDCGFSLNQAVTNS